MKYPAIGLVTLFLRSFADALEKNNSGDADALEKNNSGDAEASIPPHTVTEPPLTGEPTTEKPKRTRRTAEQIAADEKAAAEKSQAVLNAANAALDTSRAQRGTEPTPTGKTAEDLYQERRKAFDPLLTCTPSRVDEVKAVLRKYTDSPNANRDLPADKHEAFLKDIEALKL